MPFRKAATSVVVSIIVALPLSAASTLTDAQSMARNGSFPWASPDGTQIVFESNRSGTMQLYVINTDGTHERQLTALPSGAMIPVWGPDGQWIFFQVANRPAGASRATRELHVLRPNGADEHFVAPLPAGGWPRISGDGKRIALLTVDSTGASVIATM